MKYSVNNRVVVEAYVKEALKATKIAGIATPGQRDGVKGLILLMDALSADGKTTLAFKGSLAFIREEALYSHPATQKHYSSETIPQKFMILDIGLVEFFQTPSEPMTD